MELLYSLSAFYQAEKDSQCGFYKTFILKSKCGSVVPGRQSTGSHQSSAVGLLRLNVVVVVVVYFIQLIIAIQYNIILYNIQNRKTEKVLAEAKILIYFYPKLL